MPTLGRRKAEQVIKIPRINIDAMGELERSPAVLPQTGMVSAVLFGTGELKQLEHGSDVYGLILAGYQGLAFGDDGTFTGRVAAEFTLGTESILELEARMDRAVRELRPGYCAQYIGGISVAKAEACLALDVKARLGVAIPPEVRWDTGVLYT